MMKIYTILCLEMFGEDRSTETGILEAYTTEADAIQAAENIFREFKHKNSKEMQKYANAMYDAALAIEEGDGSYCIAWGAGNDYVFFNVWVESCELKGEIK